MRFMTPVAVLFAAAVSAAPAAAHDAMRPYDEVVVQLSAEGWVDTGSARVVAVVRKVLSGEQAGNTGERVPEALHELAPEAEWHVVRFDRSRDESGLERWRITAEARLPEEKLSGIYDRARSVSQPGQQVEIADIDFSPTLDEREATTARLRQEIYTQAQAEARRVAEAFPQADYRVTRVDFLAGGPVPQPYAMDKMMRAQAAPMAMESAESGSGVQGVSERLVLNAIVTIGSPPAEGDAQP